MKVFHSSLGWEMKKSAQHGPLLRLVAKYKKKSVKSGPTHEGLTS